MTPTQYTKEPEDKRPVFEDSQAVEEGEVDPGVQRMRGVEGRRARDPFCCVLEVGQSHGDVGGEGAEWPSHLEQTAEGDRFLIVSSCATIPTVRNASRTYSHPAAVDFAHTASQGGRSELFSQRFNSGRGEADQSAHDKMMLRRKGDELLSATAPRAMEQTRIPRETGRTSTASTRRSYPSGAPLRTPRRADRRPRR